MGARLSSDHGGGQRCSPLGHCKAPVSARQGHSQGGHWGLLWGQSHPLQPGGLCSVDNQPSCPQRSLNCNNTYSEEPNMFRTALGESTASLDSTLRSGRARALAVVSGEGRPRSRSERRLHHLHPKPAGKGPSSVCCPS